MSLIGPRPDPPDWLDKYPEDIKIFLTVKPGLTGYSQLLDVEQVKEKLLTLQYIRDELAEWENR